jgi:hypothetical protein
MEEVLKSASLRVNRDGVDLVDYALRRGGRDPYAIVFERSYGWEQSVSELEEICRSVIKRRCLREPDRVAAL